MGGWVDETFLLGLWWVGGWERRRTVRQGIQAHVGNVPRPNIRQIPLRIHIEIIGHGEPKVLLAATQPILKDQASNSTALAHAGCIGGWVGGRVEEEEAV